MTVSRPSISLQANLMFCFDVLDEFMFPYSYYADTEAVYYQMLLLMNLFLIKLEGCSWGGQSLKRVEYIRWL